MTHKQEVDLLQRVIDIESTTAQQKTEATRLRDLHALMQVIEENFFDVAIINPDANSETLRLNIKQNL